MPALPQLLAPLFGAVALGALAGGFRLFDQAAARLFSRFVFLVAMPLAVFTAMATATPPDIRFAGLIASYLVATGIVASAAFLIARRLAGATIREAGAAVFSTLCGNAVFLGLPIALSLPGWGPAFLVLMIFEGSVVFAIGNALLTWPEGEGESDRPVAAVVRDAILRGLRNPIVVATFLGMGVAYSGLALPELLFSPLALMGSVASPFGLFILGLTVVLLMRSRAGGAGPVLWPLLALKLVVYPVICGGLTFALTGDALLASVGAFFTGLSPAVSSVVLASAYGQWERGAAAIVSVGTLIGLGTSTLLLALLT